MKLYGLTGGVGMGKSAAAELLQRRGLAVVDTDDLAREVVEPGQPALAEIRQIFGEDVLEPAGRLRRGELARRVFAEASLRKQLEAVLHPRIRALWLERVTAWRERGVAAGVVVIPLLFETDAASHFDATICIACSAAAQERRLLARAWTFEQIQRRSQAQLPIGRKLELADYVVWNEAGLEVCDEQLGRILSH
jgi:dephospho-CoA kinase